MSFATLEEAWGESWGTLQVSEAKSKQAQDEVLDRAEASQRSQAFVTNYLREMYERHGVAGLMGLMDDRMVSELRMAALLSFDWLDANTMLLIFMSLCGVWLLMDILRRR